MLLYYLSFLLEDSSLISLFFNMFLAHSNKLPPAIVNNPISLLLSMSAIFKKQLRFLYKL